MTFFFLAFYLKDPMLYIDGASHLQDHEHLKQL
jgi:hypothetical protein